MNTDRRALFAGLRWMLNERNGRFTKDMTGLVGVIVILTFDASG